jgi:hypothetical protein
MLRLNFRLLLFGELHIRCQSRIAQRAISSRHVYCSGGVRVKIGLKHKYLGRERCARFRDATEVLISTLDERLRLWFKALEGGVRRQQIGSGMRGDKKRRYRPQYDTVVAHVM